MGAFGKSQGTGLQGYCGLATKKKAAPYSSEHSHHAEADEGALCAGVGSGFKSKGVGAAKDGAVL